MQVILISGKAEAGKTTTANLIKGYLQSYGKRVAIVPYGAYVKHTAKLLFDWNGKKDIVGRAMLQHWGTDVVRAQKPDFWIKAVVDLAMLAKDELDYFIIDDVRFENEISVWYNYPSTFPTITIRVDRPGHENSLTPAQRQHLSETALDYHIGFDAFLRASNREELSREVWEKVTPLLKL